MIVFNVSAGFGGKDIGKRLSGWVCTVRGVWLFPVVLVLIGINCVGTECSGSHSQLARKKTTTWLSLMFHNVGVLVIRCLCVVRGSKYWSLCNLCASVPGLLSCGSVVDAG